MPVERFQLPLTDGRALEVHRWAPPGAVHAALLVVHGMAEHGARYARFAAVMNAQGFAVHAPDLPGHGLSVHAPADRGFFAERDGWAYALDAIHRARAELHARHPDVPLFVLGHSMGSFLGQHYLRTRGEGLAGVILSATHGSLGPMRAPGAWLLRAEGRLFGARHPSALAERLSFAKFNKAFAPTRTAFDWLSRDTAEVDRYIADPLCGFRCSARLWVDLLEAGAHLCSPAALAGIPKSLPILLIAGDADPVSAGEAGPRLLAKAYAAAGVQDVETRFYAGARHELLNETCRAQVMADLGRWIEARLAPPVAA